MFSLPEVAQGSAARNEWTNALHAKVWWKDGQTAVYECLLVLNNIAIQMVPGGFEVKTPGKERCSHLGFLSTRPKVK